MSAPIVAMVLAAGRGRRMQPLSDVVAKPALPLPGGPLLGWAIRQARRAGAARVVVNAWHLAGSVERALARLALSGEMLCSHEQSLMGTAGGLALARDRGLLGEEGPVLVLNGDSMSDLELAPLLESAAATDAEVALALLPHRDPGRWSRVVLDRRGWVRAIVAPRPGDSDGSGLLYPGVMLVSRHALERLPAAPGEIPERLWRPAIERRTLLGVEVSGRWREVGDPDAYLEAALTELAGRTVVSADAAVDPAARVVASLVADGARVERDAEVRRSVVACGARVATGARVVDSLVLGATVASGMRLEGEVRARRRGRC